MIQSNGFPFVLRCLAVLAGALFSLSSVGQGPDSSRLVMKKLTADDVIIQPKEQQKVVSSGRVARDLEDISYTIHVVTRQEILDNGYTSLVEVLKDVPGFRVSQPGSALDGEAFVSRGLYGNYYTKILVNSLPIAPSVLAGMPLGAQLPIRQAERIEIIMGPAAAIFGSDAMGGVINIITKDPDKAVFAQADASTGNYGLVNLNLMVGGKSGQGKNLLNYNIWGGFHERDDHPIKYDREVNYNPLLYDPRANFLSSPNYEGSIDSIPMGELPSSSRYLGADINFRNFSVAYNYLSRQVHSAIGLNPIVAAYDESGQTYGEEIQRLTARYERIRGDIQLNTNLSWLIHRSYPGSHIESLQNFTHDGDNFIYAASDDLYGEQIIAWTINNQDALVGGITGQFSGNLPFTSYLLAPFEESDYSSFSTNQLSAQITSTNSPDGIVSQEVLLPDPITFSQVSAFAEFTHTSDGFGFQAGARFDQNSQQGSSISPRVAGTYKLNRNHVFRVSFSRANKIPSSFFRFNSLVWDTVSLDSLPVYAPVENDSLTTEKLLAAEVGWRGAFGENVSLDVSVYFNNLRDHINYSINDRDDFLNGNAGFIGYVSDENAISNLLGLQANLILTDLVPSIKLRSNLYASLAAGTYNLPFGLGSLDGWPMTPTAMAKWNVYCSPLRSDKLLVGVKNTFSSGWISRNAYTTARYNSVDYLDLPAYYTMDLIGRWVINKNYQGYAKVTNVFNTHYAGLGATGTIFDLAYNPQNGRLYEFGLSFRFE